MRGVNVGCGGKGVRTGDSWGQGRWKVLQMEVGDGCTAVCKHERHRAVRMGNSMFCVFCIKKTKSTTGCILDTDRAWGTEILEVRQRAQEGALSAHGFWKPLRAP